MQTSGAPEPSTSQATDLWGSLQPDDVRVAASLCHDALAPLAEADWSRAAHSLEWDCRHTLEHIPRALDNYTQALVVASPEPYASLWYRYPECSVRDLLAVVQRRAAVLACVAAVADPAVRGYHVWGLADPAAYVAMGCAEILLHTDDLTQGFDRSFRPPDALCERIVRRLFPWAPTDVDGWSALRWATGRLDLPGYGRVTANWAWHASPLAEWDGTARTRESYTIAR
jgi:hypothetical protein